MIKTQKKRTPNTKFHTVSLFVIRDKGTTENERRYDSEVVDRNIQNKVDLKCITEDTLHQIRQVDCVQFEIYNLTEY